MATKCSKAFEVNPGRIFQFESPTRSLMRIANNIECEKKNFYGFSREISLQCFLKVASLSLLAMPRW